MPIWKGCQRSSWAVLGHVLPCLVSSLLMGHRTAPCLIFVQGRLAEDDIQVGEVEPWCLNELQNAPF